jgi:hypothetical protein
MHTYHNLLERPVGEQEKPKAEKIAKVVVAPGSAKANWRDEFMTAEQKQKELESLRLELTAQEEQYNQQQGRVAELEAQLAMTRRQLSQFGPENIRLLAEREVLVEREKGLAHVLTQKEVEIQRDRAELHAQFAEREASLRREMENQQAALREREATFRAQSHELTARTVALENEHAILKRELEQRVVEHEKAIAALVRQKEQFEADFQAKMESKAAEYVDTALGALKASEERFDAIGSKWALGGLLGVLIGLVLAYFLTTEATGRIVSNKDISWSLILFFGAKGAILLGLVVAMVRLCMRLARNYMQESLKSAERRHAINYGKFYLSVYGAGTDGEKLKDVFAHWNIAGSSAFAEKDDPLPQPSISEIGELAKALVGLKKSGKETDKD